MKLTRRDGIATALVLAVVVPYVGYVVRGSMPFIEDPRGMAATGLILGAIAFAVVGRKAFGSGAAMWTAAVVGVASVGLGIAALWLESEVLLAAFVVGIVLLWAIEMLDHVGAFSHGEAPSLR